ncbi:lipopolysaccharide biosynthesis protein [Sphingomonas cavernae]|uniref:Lipopolysaccharide biosynthesis protein n=1 Tax=Sphingomonas cavernae TaxID=2320861 RepID=A0A418WKT6_9SPHN|nr:lipopolysaccharide biosynthesis protein [Sphingomonas cavernae]RJF90667.1 lipopolysaccharide biosynthesis protein [Sphingomonas cavernae]
MQNLSARLARGSMWISASRGLVGALGFLSTIVLARLLLPSDFGLVALGMTMLLILQSFTNLSLAQALVHHRKPDRDHFHTAWTLNMLRGLLLGGLFAAAGPAAAVFYGDARLANIMYALAFSIFLSGLANPRRIMLQKELIFWQDFVLNVSQKLIGVIVGVAVAVIYKSYWALVAGTIAGQLAQVIISYTVLPFLPRPTLKHARELWSFSAWLALSQAINTINWRFDQLLVGKFLGSAALGYYTVGSNLSTTPTREATLPLTQTLFPAFTKFAHDRERLRRAYQRAQAVVTAIALPMGVGMAMIAEPLVLLAMGEKWLPVVPVIETLAAIIAVQTLGSQVVPLGMSLGATRLLFVRDTQSFFVRVPLIMAGMYFAGLQGVIYARVLTGLIATMINMRMVRRLIALPVRAQLAANLRCFVAVIVMSAALWAVGRFFVHDRSPVQLVAEIAVLVLVGGLSYVAATFALWLVAGRPDGPEREIQQLVGTGLSKLFTGTRG